MRSPNYKRLPEHGEWTYRKRWGNTRVIIPRHVAGPWYRCRDNRVFYFDPIERDFRAAIAVSYKDFNYSASGTSAVSGLTVGAGSTLVACINFYDKAQSISSAVYNDGSDNFPLTARVSNIGSHDGANCAIWSLDNAASSGSGTVSVTVSGSTQTSFALYEITGAKTSGAFDKSASSSGRSSTPSSGTTATLSQAEEVAIGVMSYDNYSSDWGGTFNGTCTENTVEETTFNSATRVVASTSGVSISKTGTSKEYFSACVASFMAAAAPSSAVKTVSGLAKASVKTVMGLPIASVKTVNGLA